MGSQLSGIGSGVKILVVLRVKIPIAWNRTMYLHSDSDDSQSDVEFSLPTQTHTVTFKCIGSTYDQIAQESLSRPANYFEMGQMCKRNSNRSPPTNTTIDFMCYVDNKWQRIGYVVRECLEHVHKVLSGNQILSVKLCWAKYFGVLGTFWTKLFFMLELTFL